MVSKKKTIMEEKLVMMITEEMIMNKTTRIPK
jgi:hypothetical protein